MQLDKNTATAEQNAAITPPSEGTEGLGLRESIITALKTVRDPEIPVNIYDLGLIYGIDLSPSADGQGQNVSITMTLTAPGCPVAGEMPEMVRQASLTVEGVAASQVALVWDPPWTPARMSDEARLSLNMF